MAAPLDPLTVVLSAYSTHVLHNAVETPESSTNPTLLTNPGPDAIEAITNIAYTFYPPSGLSILSSGSANVLLAEQEF